MSVSRDSSRPMDLQWTGVDVATLSIGDLAIDLTADEVEQLIEALFPLSPADRGREHIQRLRDCLDELHATDNGTRAYDLAPATDSADLYWLDLRLARLWDHSMTRPKHRAQWPEIGWHRAVRTRCSPTGPPPDSRQYRHGCRPRTRRLNSEVATSDASSVSSIEAIGSNGS